MLVVELGIEHNQPFFSRSFFAVVMNETAEFVCFVLYQQIKRTCFQ